MKKYIKGTNIIHNLVGSSYLIEIDKFLNEFNTIIIALDNNHQIDNLYNELFNFYEDLHIYKFQIMD